MLTRPRNNIARIAGLLAITLALALSLTSLVACSADEPVAPVEEGPKLATPSAAVSGELDPGHPDNLPIWEGSTVVASALTGETVYELELTTTDPYDDVVYGIGKGLEDEGFTVEALDESPEVTIFMAVKGDLAALYTMAPSEDGSTVSIGVSAQLPSGE